MFDEWKGLKGRVPPKEKQKKMGSVYCARNLDEEIPLMNAPRFAAKIDGPVKIKVGLTKYKPRPFDGLEVREEARAGLSKSATQVGKWNHFFHIECEEPWHTWCIENYINGSTIKCADYPVGQRRLSEDESWMGRYRVRVEGKSEIAYTQPSILRGLFMDIVKSPGMVGLPDDTRLVFVDSDGSRTDDFNKKRKRGPDEELPQYDDDNESIAETEVPNDYKPLIDSDLGNVQSIMDSCDITHKKGRCRGQQPVWKMANVHRSRHAMTKGGIEMNDGTVWYGENDELLGVLLDPNSRSSCDLYIKMCRQRKQALRCNGYLQSSLGVFLLIIEDREGYTTAPRV